MGEKLQFFTYTIGIIFVILSFVEFGYGTVLHEQMSFLQEKSDKMDDIRDNLWKLKTGYNEVYEDVVNADWTTYYKVTDGWISELEGNITIIGTIPGLLKMDYFFYVNFLINYQDGDYRWLFVDGILDIYYAGEDISYIHSSLAEYEFLIEEDFPQWTTTLYTTDFNWFVWENTVKIMMDWKPTTAALLIAVDFVKFDEFVAENYLNPLIEAERSLNRLLVITGANTIGILLLGFLIDFGNVSERMKKIYLIIACIAVGVAVFSSSATIIRIIMGGM